MSVIGFRRWRVTDGRLRPMGVDAPPWTPGVQTASCQPPSGGVIAVAIGPTGQYVVTGYPCTPVVAGGHPVPSILSRCGIWAHKLPIAPCECSYPAAGYHQAVGVVRLWGRYVEHETGWRAQHARLVALVDYTGRVRPEYDVPRYPDLAAMYAEWAPDAAGQWAPGEEPVWHDRVAAFAAHLDKAHRDLAAAIAAAGKTHVGMDTLLGKAEFIRQITAGQVPPDPPTPEELLEQLRERHQEPARPGPSRAVPAEAEAPVNPSDVTTPLASLFLMLLVWRFIALTARTRNPIAAASETLADLGVLIICVVTAAADGARETRDARRAGQRRTLVEPPW